MEQLIYEIAGRKYLLFNYPFSQTEKINKFLEVVKKFGGILQSADVTLGWFSGKANVRVLIPEEKAVEFSNYDHK